MSCRIGWAVFAVAIASLPLASAVADEAKLREEVARLFELGWQPSLQAQVAAKEQAFKLVEMAPDDSRIAYAYALVLIRQRKYPDADRLLNRVLVKEKENLYAWRTKIWLSMLQKEYANALLGMERVSALLAAAGPAATASQDNEVRQEMAGFLGRSVGFLAGPALEPGDPLGIEKQHEKILSGLDAGQRQAFIEGCDNVTDRYAELTGEGSRNKEQALADAEVRKREVQATLEKQQEQIAAERAEVEPKRESLESQFRSEMAELESRAQPLFERLTRLESEAAVVRRQALNLAADIDSLQDSASDTDDPYERDRLLREADRLTIYYRRHEVELSGMQAEAAGIHAQRNQLLIQQQQAQARYQGELGRLAGKLEGLERELKRIVAEDRKLSKPVSGNTPRVRDLARVATAFTTYDQLPLERERQRVLDSFK